MAAAIEAKRSDWDKQVCILEKNSILGKKIYATGNGKCNLSNVNCSNPFAVNKFLDSIGIFTRTDDAGRMYPGSEQASDVVLSLERALQQLGVEVMRDIVIKTLVKNSNAFEVKLSDGRTIVARRLLLATGGKAGPQYGNIGDGYGFAKGFGHSVNRTYPVLSPVECIGDFEQLKGIRAKGRVSLLRENHQVATEDGEIQFTEDGLSGICIFNLSRFIQLNPNQRIQDAFGEYTICVDFIPKLNQQELEVYLMKKASMEGCEISQLLSTMVHKGIGDDIFKRVSINPDRSTESLTPEQIHLIAGIMKKWCCTISGVKGWKKAQCTGGGVPLHEVDEETFESKIVKGLYFAGELLDYDGPSGGFNLHFAWESGIKAGKAMADEQV